MQVAVGPAAPSDDCAHAGSQPVMSLLLIAQSVALLHLPVPDAQTGAAPPVPVNPPVLLLPPVVLPTPPLLAPPLLAPPLVLLVPPLALLAPPLVVLVPPLVLLVPAEEPPVALSPPEPFVPDGVGSLEPQPAARRAMSAAVPVVIECA
jgi:hypothetical protein